MTRWIAYGFVAWASCQFATTTANAQLPLDNYDYTLPGMDPGGYWQTNYLYNRLLLLQTKKAESEYRRDTQEIRRETRTVGRLRDLDAGLARLGGRQASQARDLELLWDLAAAFGDDRAVYAALRNPVPQMDAGEFGCTSKIFDVVEPDGRLKPPPLLLQGEGAPSALAMSDAFRPLGDALKAGNELNAVAARTFEGAVEEYCAAANQFVDTSTRTSARMQADDYLGALGVLVDTMYRTERLNELACYTRSNGYRFEGGDMMSMLQFMLRNRIVPKNGSVAQVSVAELVRCLRSAMKQEIDDRLARIDAMERQDRVTTLAAESRGTLGMPEVTIPVSTQMESDSDF